MRLGEIKNRELSELKPYENNTKNHPPEQINQIINSIKEFGFIDPVLINEKGVIIAGHGRYEASNKLKKDTIPTITIYDLSPEQEKALRIAHNKIGLNSGLDSVKLKQEVEELLSKGFDLNITGFSDDEFSSILGGLSTPTFNSGDEDNNYEGDNYNTDDYEYEGGLEGEYDEENAEVINDDFYTKKIDIPIYKVTGEKPKLSELIDNKKQKQLARDIKKVELPEEIKQFLLAASYRHTVFNYEKIAEYYAHSSKEIQELMEESALVIIDFNKAIRNGYTRLSEEITNRFIEDYGIEE